MEIEALQHTVYQYSQRLKTLEDFISFQFGEAYQQFRCHKSEDEDSQEIDDGSPWEKPAVSQKRESKKSRKVNIKKEIDTTVELVEVTEEEDETSTSYNYVSQKSSSSHRFKAKEDIHQQLCYLVPESLEVDFVSDPSSEVDPIEVQDSFWTEDNEEEEEINSSEMYEMYEDEETDDQANETMPKITGTASFNGSLARFEASSVQRQNSSLQQNSMQLKYKSNECPFCVTCFVSRNTMFQHILDDHTGGKNYCPKCQKSYTFQKDFRCHLSRHDKRNRIRFKCTYCVKYFGSRKELNNHERIHTGEKPYSCTTCQRVFRTSSSLIRHQKCHGQYVCKLADCKLRFLLYKELLQHQKEYNHQY